MKREKNEKRHEMRYRFEQSEKVHKLYVYDDVSAQGEFNWKTWQYEDSETSAKYFRDRLNEIPDGAEIELHVNSAGGEVGEGVAIYNLLVQKRKAGSRIVGYVDGMAYSVAMDIIMACDEIHMGYGTSMFLHNPWTIAVGNAEQLRGIADQLDALADASAQLYLSRAKGLGEEELKELMRRETMLAPDTCRQYGFCDFVGNGNEEKPDEDPDSDETDDDPDDDIDDPDDRDRLVQQLKEQLYQQKQINQMLKGISRKSTVKSVFAKAVQINQQKKGEKK